ncbi:hemerythrin domain-containing protein [Streptomyces sp. ODS05-4]|uniref:hemerythrin domain-containing protein n=1 Tax=Streptomyces sp. ODS05-4 TaxID=2944939 RepID=UPI00210B3A0A|nr:hemerythrin domain-containing protein [Streptomyces sp. ODS05-4]
MAGDDVVRLILEDHRTMEDLLRRMRSVDEDRAGALREFAGLLVAHAEAEEAEVYPALKRYKNVDDEEVEHGSKEHDDGNAALLGLLETDLADAEAWDEALEDLSEAVTHHLDEEERSLLNDARENVSDERREALGRAFRERRAELLKADCGSVDNVRRLVKG